MTDPQVSYTPSPPNLFTDTITELDFEFRRRKKGGYAGKLDMVIPQYLDPDLNGKYGQFVPQYAANVIHRSGEITAAGNSTVWTPAPGRSIRLMGFSVLVDPLTTTAAGALVNIIDITANNILDDAVILGTAAPGVPFVSQRLGPPNGIQLPVGDVLGIVLSAACTAGGIEVNFYGCEV